MDRRWDKSKPPSGAFVLNRDSFQAQGLLSWWPLARGGDRHHDFGPNNAHGTGALATRTRGKDGQPAVTFNGSSEYIDVGAGKFPFLKTTPFSLFARLRTTTSGAGAIICDWNNPVTPGWHWIVNTGGVVNMLVSDSDGTNYYQATSSGAINDGKQHDVLFTHDGSASGSGIAGFFDGVTQTMTPGSAGSGDPGVLADGAFQIGARAGAVFFPGDLSDIRVYNTIADSALRVRALSDPATKYELWYPIRSRKWISTATPATAVTMSGPTSGYVSAASTNFSIGANGVITGTVTVTPSDGGAGGTFTPSSVAINSGSPTATFTYTPASTGAKTISVTNNGSLSNPSNISYTSNSNLPGKPTSVVASAGSGAASVTFTPGDTGGATVTYTVTASPGGASNTGSASPITVSGLTNGVAYTFTVSPANVNGTGTLSDPSNSVTPAAAIEACKLAPFVGSDTLATVVAQAFIDVAGTMTATGTAPTVNTVANVSNGRQVNVSVPPNGADGSFYGVLRWATGSGEYFPEELNIPAPNASPGSTSTTVMKVCNLPEGTDVSGTPGYQRRDATNTAIGSRVTSGIRTIPSVVGPSKLCAALTGTPGTTEFIVWDNGAGVYSQDEVQFPPAAAAATGFPSTSRLGGLLQ